MIYRSGSWEVSSVERVLAPLLVALIVVSNITLLAHEANVVWKTQRLIQPKLLVLALCTADLLATILGFLPLWILFRLPIDFQIDVSEIPSQHSAHLINPSHSLSSLSQTSSVNATESSLLNATHNFTTAPTISSSVLTNYQVTYWSTPACVDSGVYRASVFLQTLFWTLAQFVVVVMGVERFLALRTPFFYSSRCSVIAFLALLGVLVILSSAIAAFHLVIHMQELEETKGQFTFTLDFPTYSSSPVQLDLKEEHARLTGRVKDQVMVFAGFVDSRSLAHNVYTLVQGIIWSAVLVVCNWAVLHELRQMEKKVS